MSDEPHDVPTDGIMPQPPLPEDNDNPASPPTDPIHDTSADIDERTAANQLDPTHPATDNATDIEPAEEYDEGLSGAAEAEEPNAGNAVVGYHPEEKQKG